MHNERWLELALFANRRRYLVPVSFETLAAERDDLFAKHPKTRFISAHFGWHANDLGHAAKLLDAHPNVVLELAAILYDLGRQPRAAHDFFVKYQDRILFGKDTYAPDGISVLLARARDARRVLRLLPRLSRVLEDVRHRTCRMWCCGRSTTRMLSESRRDYLIGNRARTRVVESAGADTILHYGIEAGILEP